MTEFAFGVKRRLYNYNLRRLREEKGLSMKELASAAGISLGYLFIIQSFRAYPSENVAIKLAAVLNTTIEALFPEDIKRFHLKRGTLSKEDTRISLSEAKKMGLFSATELLISGPDDAIDASIDMEIKHDGIQEVLNTLNPREKEVLQFRFGLVNGDSRSLEDIGYVLGVTRERIRQIETKALNRLRCPKNRRKLKAFL